MTKEEAWLMWMSATKATDTPIEIDFGIIKKTSWWAAFSTGWDAATLNTNGWDDAYKIGIEAGKEIKKEWVGLTDSEGAEIWADAHDLDWIRLVTPKEIVARIEAKLKEKNT
jgi:hypothetical protein